MYFHLPTIDCIVPTQMLNIRLRCEDITVRPISLTKLRYRSGLTANSDIGRESQENRRGILLSLQENKKQASCFPRSVPKEKAYKLLTLSLSYHVLRIYPSSPFQVPFFKAPSETIVLSMAPSEAGGIAAVIVGSAVGLVLVAYIILCIQQKTYKNWLQLCSRKQKPAPPESSNTSFFTPPSHPPSDPSGSFHTAPSGPPTQPSGSFHTAPSGTQSSHGRP